MTIKEYLQQGRAERLAKLKEIRAPQIVIEHAERSLARGPRPSGDKTLLDLEVESYEVRVGRGGKEYIAFKVVNHPEVLYFPNARFGSFIKIVDK